MPFVYLNPASYVVGKSISFEEYAQLVENANQAYGAGTNHGEIFATRVSAAAVGVSVSGASGVYTFTVPAGVTQLTVEGIGGGGGGGYKSGSGNPGGGGASGAYQASIVLAVTPGETITITVGAGGLGATVANTAGANGGATTVVGSVSGSLLTINGGGGGLASGTGGTGGTLSSGRGWPGLDGSNTTLGNGSGNPYSPWFNAPGLGGGLAASGLGAGGGGQLNGSGGNGSGGAIRISF